MALHIIDHPLVQHKLSNKETSTNKFRELLKEISLFMGYEVTRDFPLTYKEIETPLMKMNAPKMAGKKVVIAPILRARLGMVDGLITLIPSAKNTTISPPMPIVSPTPLKFIDPDGCNPRVYVETKGLGHVFVTTGTGKNTIVYTYGRYGDIYKNKSSARSTSPIGQGILVILKGEDAAEFIKEEINNYDAEIFEFTKASDIKVENYFMELFNSSDELPKNKNMLIIIVQELLTTITYLQTTVLQHR